MDKPKTPLLKRPLIRVLVIWAIQTVALLIMAWLMNSVALDNLIAGIVATAVIGLLNALLWPLLSDVMAGRSSAYATFVSYDEIAHHSGILDPGCFDIPRKVDDWFGRLERATKQAPRPYHLVVLSDHGQTGGATFKQRYGLTLQECVQALMTEGKTVGGEEFSSAEGTANLNTFLNDAVKNDPSAATQVVKRALQGRMVDGEIVPGEKARQEAQEVAKKEAGQAEDQPDVIAVASGNLGIVSFTQWPARMTKEEIDEAFPAVISGLAEHEGIGFVMVRSKREGAMAIGARGVYYLNDDRIEGENPWPCSGRTQPTTCGAPTASTTVPTSWSTASTTQRRTKAAPLRSWSASMAGWGHSGSALHPAPCRTASARR